MGSLNMSCMTDIGLKILKYISLFIEQNSCKLNVILIIHFSTQHYHTVLHAIGCGYVSLFPRLCIMKIVPQDQATNHATT